MKYDGEARNEGRQSSIHGECNMFFQSSALKLITHGLTDLGKMPFYPKHPSPRTYVL